MNLWENYHDAMEAREKMRKKTEEARAEILRILGRRLRSVRESRQYSLAEVAEKANVTSGFLSQIELGYRTPPLKVVRIYYEIEQQAESE